MAFPYQINHIVYFLGKSLYDPIITIWDQKKKKLFNIIYLMHVINRNAALSLLFTWPNNMPLIIIINALFKNNRKTLRYKKKYLKARKTKQGNNKPVSEYNNSNTTIIKKIYIIQEEKYHSMQQIMFAYNIHGGARKHEPLNCSLNIYKCKFRKTRMIDFYLITDFLFITNFTRTWKKLK